MGQLVVDEDRFAGMLAEVRPHLDELQWRLLLGAQARSLGRGGIKRVAELTGVHPDTVGGVPGSWSGALSLMGGCAGRGRAGPAPRRLTRRWCLALKALVDPETRGDPESPLRWTTKLRATFRMR